jgi:hypothetical protein
MDSQPLLGPLDIYATQQRKRTACGHPSGHTDCRDLNHCDLLSKKQGPSIRPFSLSRHPHTGINTASKQP